jgi:hypothetical protein
MRSRRGAFPSTRPPARARAILAIVLASALGLGLGRPVAWTLAVIGDIETVPSTFSTETLDPPTSLTATAQIPLIVNLSWTATVDTRATGYEVFRGTVNGGPYTQIGTVTSRTTTTYQDLPIVPGTYYYVLKTYFGSWTSVNSNQASATAL